MNGSSTQSVQLDTSSLVLIMTRPQYATYPSGSSFHNTFPCSTALAGPIDYYKKASLSLSEQQRKSSLQVPGLTDTKGFAGTQQFATADIVTALSVGGQYTIHDLTAIKDGLTSSKVCSRQAVRKIAAQLLPVKASMGKEASAATEYSGNLTFEALSSFNSQGINSLYTELPTPVWPKTQAQV